MAEQILIVEDDDRIRAMLRLALEDEGYDVREAPSGESAVEQMRSAPADMLIVDLMLGGMDGFTCIREVRRSSDAPVIVVSARSDTHDIVAGLEAGADDYVTKPFQVKEITARLRALRRRAARPDPAPALPGDLVLARRADGDLVLSPAAGELRRGDEEVHLTLTEFRLLCELAAVPRQVLSRGTLLDKVWDQGFFGDERLVDVHVRRLRTKVEEDPGSPRVIVTVRGLGYRLDPA
ncbi:DNA-binding response OmpR family regulator [Motilibacter peucedani]|uniref:DNA-binding response OmpR family regulator n=1 Tax=Motilibacter peucedani TaxID=598650 RepID=A0A420XQP4_9ACTN|nr:response regulator transcription factor [Motilibacter peucedani]RKS75567.1 DNA-binding response OmpR family regulator [Motilibacter peucedani]